MTRQKQRIGNFSLKMEMVLGITIKTVSIIHIVPRDFWGQLKQIRNIVRVWTKFEDRIIFLEELRCSQRESQTIEYQSLKMDLSFLSFLPDQPEGTKPLPGEVAKTFDNYRGQKRIPIIPGSRREKLYNEVCK